MGLLFRMLAPRPLKQVRRLAHPVSLMTPRAVQRAKMMGVNAANPVCGFKRAAETALVSGVRGSGSRSRVSYVSQRVGHARCVADVHEP